MIGDGRPTNSRSTVTVTRVRPGIVRSLAERLLAIDRKTGRVVAQLDHDPVRIDEVERVAPVVIDVHQRLDAGRGHALLHLLLPGCGRAERDVVDPHRQAVPGRDLALPVRLLSDAVHVEEREAAAVAGVEEEVAKEAARPGLAAHLCMEQRHPHELVVEAHGGVDVAAGEGDVVDCRLGHESPLHVCVIDTDATPAGSEGPS